MRPKKTKHLNLKYLLIILAIIFAIILVFYLLQNKNKSGTGLTTDSNRAQQIQSTPIKPEPNNNSDSSANKQPNTSNSQTQPNGASLIKPYGTFVSNHAPSLKNENGVPSAEQSICQGTPGANCYISFTKNGSVKNLPIQKLDSSGSTQWNWDVKKSGFNVGEWKITAVSTLNGKTYSTTDALNLSVKP